MFNSVIPSNNPADTNSESGKNDFLFDKLLSKIEKIAPAQIISYDRQKNRAVVQILNQSITSQGGKITRQPLKDIPALVLCGGDYVLSFPIKEGDVGWICAADRNISIFKQTLKMFAPATYEKHRYKDSFFIPNYINGFTYDAADENAVLLTSTDGTTKISIKDGAVTITSASITLNGNVLVNGTLTVTESITTASTVTATGEVMGNGIALSTHIHGGVASGNNTTGVPQ